ncbi:hypothetical protein NV379_17215 [Paenibacillus sp. N1-5-1-14]|uniref:hypothetical protein n=1 Tax=Paenibacillus radicibacter TaxID=2972488 RepID=UPI00215974C7|nr:hypothetical protein [Paenibacillus radicibacter]MCR8644396.1 hypothetical protein [Paenibacillus radicibacter]
MSFIWSGMFINLVLIAVFFFIFSLVIKHAINKSELTKEVKELRQQLEELRNQMARK